MSKCIAVVRKETQKTNHGHLVYEISNASVDQTDREWLHGENISVFLVIILSLKNCYEILTIQNAFFLN